MSKDFIAKPQSNFIQKSNVIVRAITNESAGIMTQRLFNFAILKSKNNQNSNGEIGFWLKDFCNYYNIKQHTLYDKVTHKKQDMTVIIKELENLTSMKFFLWIENENKYGFINLFLEVFNIDGYIKLKPNKDLIAKYFIDLKKDYTNIYLPYTKVICSKYSLRLYEYLRSYLYMNARTKGIPNFQHDWSFEQIAKILNLSLNSSYFKRINNFKKYILEPVKKDLLKTDITFTYEMIKTGRKNTHIILNTVLHLKKFQSQNIEFEKISSKNIKTKSVESIFKKENMIKKSTLNPEEIKKILKEFDEH